MSDTTKLASLKDVANYFRKEGETLTQFADDWKNLPDADREEIRKGIGDGTFTY